MTRKAATRMLEAEKQTLVEDVTRAGKRKRSDTKTDQQNEKKGLNNNMNENGHASFTDESPCPTTPQHSQSTGQLTTVVTTSALKPSFNDSNLGPPPPPSITDAPTVSLDAEYKKCYAVFFAESF